MTRRHTTATAPLTGVRDAEIPPSGRELEALLHGLVSRTREAGDEVRLLRDKRATTRTWRVALRPGEGEALLEAGRIEPRTGVVPGSVILKERAERGLRAWVRRLAGRSPGEREWRAHRELARASVPAPIAWGFLRLPEAAVGDANALFIEDFGECHRWGDDLAARLDAGEAERVEAESHEVVEATRRLVHAGFVDLDHTATNFVLAPAKPWPVRIDLELVQPAGRGRTARERIGRMIGRFVATYIFAVQPHVEVAERFAETLAESIGLDPGVRHAAARVIDRMLAEQRERHGVDTPWRLRW